jgi:hypothetical protein
MVVASCFPYEPTPAAKYEAFIETVAPRKKAFNYYEDLVVTRFEILPQSAHDYAL